MICGFGYQLLMLRIECRSDLDVHVGHREKPTVNKH